MPANESAPGTGRTLAEWLVWQQQHHPRAIDLGLERVRAVALRMGLLPWRIPAVIVGGTNGKGSTATTLAALLQAAGLRTGLFTSPHLVHYNERIRIDAQPVDDAALCAAFERIEAATAGISLSFFEYNTLAALQLFAQTPVDVVVLEVGLGGRLDATNIVAADVAVICSIGMDHVDWLGNTLQQIGREKAGILRAGQRVVLGNDSMPDSVTGAVAELHCAARVAGRDFHWQSGAGQWLFNGGPGAADRLGPLPPPRLAGEIQYRNAAVAIAAWRALHEARPDAVPPAAAAIIAAGLAAVTLPARLQVIERDAEWIIDVAHNVPAAEVLVEELRRRAKRRTTAIFGMLGDKDVPGVTRVLDALVDAWWLCPIDEARGLGAAELSARMDSTRGARREFASVEAACRQALRSLGAGERVLVCGSFHVAGPALHCLEL